MNKILDSIRGSKEIVIGISLVIGNLIILAIPGLENYKTILMPSISLVGLIIAGFVTAKDIATKFTEGGKVDFEALVTDVFTKVQELINEAKDTSPLKAQGENAYGQTPAEDTEAKG